MRRARHKPRSEEREAEGVIECLGHRGEGILTLRERTIYIPLTVPGDRVRIAYAGERGTLLDILEPGPTRVPAPCPHFGPCGGCQLQHLSEAAYEAFKSDGIKAALAQRGVVAAIAPLARVPLATRRRATLGVSRTGKSIILGFHEGQSHTLSNIETCLVLAPPLAATLGPLHAWLGEILPAHARGNVHLTLAANGIDIDLALEKGHWREDAASIARRAVLPPALGIVRLTIDGAVAAQLAPPQVTFDDIAVALPPRAFLQPTQGGEALLQQWVREGVGDARRIADLFCGLGTFALPLARGAAVLAVDAQEQSLAALSIAARRHQGLKPVTVERRDLMRSPVPAAALKGFDAVVFDPPRAGAALQAGEIARAGIPRVVAVSCSPATFARDAKMLIDHGYALDWLRPLDQFPFTAHIELVAQFSKAKD